MLPLLSDEELRRVFENDAAALRRYNIISAVVHGGASADQASLQHGSSPRTVRHLLQRYRLQPGLDTLRSGRPGPQGHLRSESNAAQVVAEVYAASPQAGGGVLLSLVNERLAASNQQISRATFYRLLTAVREDQSGTERDSKRGVLRAALTSALALLQEEPPIALGSSLLARICTPPLPEGMPLERGLSLAKILTQLIANLQQGDSAANDSRSRFYAILTGEFISGELPEHVQERVAISPRTYYRAKRQAIDRLAELLPGALATLAPPLPRLADPIPQTDLLFCGRDDELAYYEWRLRTDGTAVIWGLAGSGKTALASQLAAKGQRLGQAVVWHTAGNSPDTLVRDALSALAGGLLDIGGLDMADAVRRWQQDAATLPRDQQVVRLVALLARRHCVVMIDNARRINSDAGWDFLLLELRRQAAAGHLRLVVLSRSLPDWARGGGWPALGGLDELSARKLLEASGLHPPDQPIWQVIFRRTQGHPQLLRLLAAWAQAPQAERDLTVLLDHGDIRAYLIEEMCGELSEPAMRLLRWVCLLRRPLDLDQPLGVAALAASGRRKVALAALDELSSRGLLVSPRSQIFQPPALVREHVLAQERGDRTSWRRLHTRIARAYGAADDLAEAAYHQEAAG